MCFTNPCKNGGTCSLSRSNSTGYKCYCTKDYTGATCENGKVLLTLYSNQLLKWIKNFCQDISYLSINPFSHLNACLSVSPVLLGFQSLRQVILHLALIKVVWWSWKSANHDNFKHRPCQDIIIVVINLYVERRKILTSKWVLHHRNQSCSFVK